jgi:hypothetical protein
MHKALIGARRRSRGVSRMLWNPLRSRRERRTPLAVKGRVMLRSLTDTQEILEAVATGVPLDAADLAAAIDACLRCVQTCTTCANADLAEEDVADLRVCARLCINCADVCDVTARLLSRPAQWDAFVVHRLLEACVRSCQNSAEECARHAHHHRHCAICEKTCRACARACSDLLEDETFEQLQKLAGA